MGRNGRISGSGGIFLHDGSNICGAWKQVPSHSQQHNFEYTDYTPMSRPLTCFTDQSACPHSVTHSEEGPVGQRASGLQRCTVMCSAFTSPPRSLASSSRAISSPASPIHGKFPMQGYHFLYCIFIGFFLHLGAQIPLCDNCLQYLVL